MKSIKDDASRKNIGLKEILIIWKSQMEPLLYGIIDEPAY